jgi:hypothetical protein
MGLAIGDEGRFCMRQYIGQKPQIHQHFHITVTFIRMYFAIMKTMEHKQKHAQAQPSSLSRGISGFFKGLKSGLIMMAVYAAVMTIGASIPLVVKSFSLFQGGLGTVLSKILPIASVGAAASALFAGLNGFLNDPNKQDQRQARGHEGRMRSAEITQAPQQALPIVLGQTINAEQAQHAHNHEHTQNSTAWRDRVGGGNRHDNIAAILNSETSDKGRAQAILEAREAQAGQENSRA